MMIQIKYTISTLLLALSMTSITTAEEVTTTTIVGDQELPKVLFILPWKEIDSQIPESRPPLEYSQQFGPIERAEFAHMLSLQPKQPRFKQ